MRATSLRWRLLLLAAVAILPLAVMSGVALKALLDQQREQTEQSTLDLTRALATAIDTELRLTISTLQTLAATGPLVGGTVDIDALYRLSQRVVAARPEWRVLLLAEPSGKVLFSTNFAPADVQPPITESDSFAQVVKTGAPVVGSLVSGPPGQAGVPVRIPIGAGGELRYVLTAVVKPDAIVEVVNRQRVPADWIVSVFDAKNVRIARSREQARFLGTRASPSMQEMLMRGGDEATGPTTTIEGDSVQSAMTRIRSNGWAVTIGLPTLTAESAVSHSALAYGGGILLSLGIGSLAAFLVARSIAQPIGRLREAAIAVGRGEPIEGPAGGLMEIEAVAQALATAARLRKRSEAERETLLEAERQARAAAERARQRLERLADAGSLLSRSLEEQTTLLAIASVIVPDIADLCRIDLLDPEGVLQRKLTHHRNPERERAIAALVQRSQVSADAPGSFPWVIATGKTYLENFDGPDEFGIADPAFRAFAHATGMRAVCAMPLVARGRTIGAMAAVQAESGRKFSAGDGVLLGELAQRAALALDNVRLFGEANAALRQAEVASRAKDDFLAMLGHELRNPLAPIVTSLELMARREPGRDAPERRIIERQVAHLARLVDDLLDVSRIASGKIRISPERLEMRNVVARALELAQPALQKRSRPPEIDLPDEPVWVAGDPLRLAQVVSNLLVNAVKFSASEDRIGIALRCADGQVELAVTDEGIGIPAELVPRLFERFVQGEQVLQGAAGGLGLGLAIARNLVELHGGTIRAESAGPGRGSRFVVTLPQATAPVPPLARARVAVPGTRQTARILIVDDNDDAAQALAEVLKLDGHSVRTACSGEEAIESLADFIPEIAILDIGMPGMDGYALARRLRVDDRVRGVRLIALTGYGRAPDRRRAIDAGFDEHMVKPVDIETLLTRLDALRAAAD